MNLLKNLISSVTHSPQPHHSSSNWGLYETSISSFYESTLACAPFDCLVIKMSFLLFNYKDILLENL